jgi:hypothetical protein
VDSLGRWTDSDLGGTARANAGVGADADLPDRVRFVGGVAKLVRRRMAEAAFASDPIRPAIFLLEPNAKKAQADQDPKRVPMLDNGLTAVTGRLWFVSAVVVSGKYVELEDLDDDALFTIVTETLQLGHVPAVVFDPRTAIGSIRFYPQGIGAPETCDTAAVASADVSVDRVLDVVERVYRETLITPVVQPNAGKLWEDGSKWLPSSQAEDLTQLYLRIGLTTAFPTCTVRHEQTLMPGRLDLEIEESDPLDRSKVTRHAVLELKVLKSFRSSGATVSDDETLEWITSGVRQAASYRDDRGALSAALCCFDMRKSYSGQRCFDHVKELATRLTVRLRVWFLFGTSEQFREFHTRES